MEWMEGGALTEILEEKMGDVSVDFAKYTLFNAVKSIA